jgi:hypothetical protein
MDGSSVGARLKNLRLRVQEACVASGRAPESVRILAVSKLHSRAAIRAAYDEGQRDFAENYVQEAVDKLDQLASLPVRWHFIGRIQSNKVKFLGGRRFAAIHSVDRVSVAEALNRVAHPDGGQDIFLQFNAAGEASKGGGDERVIEELAQFVNEKCPRLRVLGLMCMPPLDQPARPFFAQTRALQARLKTKFPTQPLDQLSMGTSADFSEAIAEGATWIRIGSEIFGPREEKK